MNDSKWIWHIVFCIVSTGAYDDYNRNHVEILEMNVPESPKTGEDVRLRCRFRLSPDDYQLRTVSWWRDKDQFFIYKNGIDHPKLIYSFPGIHVQEDESNFETVLLRGVSEKTSGEFRCEVMGEGPFFKTAAKEKHMMVIVPPSSLLIDSMDLRRSYYRNGDEVKMNCTAAATKPRATITWLLNDKKVLGLDVDTIVYPDRTDRNGRISTTVGISWHAPDYFVENSAEIWCTASVGRHNFTTSKIVHLDPRATEAYNQLYASHAETARLCLLFYEDLPAI